MLATSARKAHVDNFGANVKARHANFQPDVLVALRPPPDSATPLFHRRQTALAHRPIHRLPSATNLSRTFFHARVTMLDAHATS